MGRRREENGIALGGRLVLTAGCCSSERGRGEKKRRAVGSEAA